jgi:hypothetical protein
LFVEFHGAKMLHNVMHPSGALGVTGDTPLDRMYREGALRPALRRPDEVHHLVVAMSLARDYKDRAP